LHCVLLLKDVRMCPAWFEGVWLHSVTPFNDCTMCRSTATFLKSCPKPTAAQMQPNIIAAAATAVAAAAAAVAAAVVTVQQATAGQSMEVCWALVPGGLPVVCVSRCYLWLPQRPLPLLLAFQAFKPRRGA
jgi:hypothetical protein